MWAPPQIITRSCAPSNAGTPRSVDEMAQGGSSLAAAVFERDGSVRTALVIAMPTVRFAANRTRLEQAIVDGARKLSELKGYTPPMPTNAHRR